MTGRNSLSSDRDGDEVRVLRELLFGIDPSSKASHAEKPAELDVEISKTIFAQRRGCLLVKTPGLGLPGRRLAGVRAARQ